MVIKEIGILEYGGNEKIIFIIAMIVAGVIILIFLFVIVRSLMKKKTNGKKIKKDSGMIKGAKVQQLTGETGPVGTQSRGGSNVMGIQEPKQTSSKGSLSDTEKNGKNDPNSSMDFRKK